MSVISDEIVIECVNEQGQACALSQSNVANCDDDKIVGLGAPVMAVEAKIAAAPLQTDIEFDSKDCTPMHGIMSVDSALQTGDSVRSTGRLGLSAVIGDNNDLAFFDDRQAPQQQSAELINFAASDSVGDAEEHSVIREFSQIIIHDADGDLGFQILTGDISHSAVQCSDEIDVAQMSSVTSPQCETAERVEAESVGPPGAINANNSTMAADTEHTAGQGNPGVQVLITRRARQEACNGAQISCDSERTGSTSAAEPASDSDTNLGDDSNQGHGGLQKGVSARDETAAKGPGQVTVEPCGKGGPQTVIINGDNSKTEWSDWAKATKPCSKLRAKVPRYVMKIFEMMSRYRTDAKCKSHATVKYKMDPYIYGRIT